MTAVAADNQTPPAISNRSIIAVIIGNWFEFYDFIVYTFFAVMIADAFFPGDDAFLRLLASLITFGVGFATRPIGALLVIHLLRRSGEGRQAIGLDMRDWKRDLLRGAVLAAVLGGIGLVFYLAAYKLGMNVRIDAVTTDRTWWTPLLLLSSAAYNAILEEVIVLAYFLHRAAQIGWKPWQQVGGSALVRGAYHLYQGFGGFLGNLAMGAVFALLFRRWGRVMPFLWAHLFIDATAFLGYYYLHGHVSWLP